MKIHLIFCCIEQNQLISKFLEHYKEQGCDNAICLVEKHIDCNCILKVFPEAKIYLGNLSLDARIKKHDHNAMRRKIPEDSWYVVADVDEFALHETKTLKEIIHETKHDHIRGYLVDRHTKDFSLPRHLEKDIWQQFPRKSKFSEEHGAVTQKIVAAQKHLPISTGHHNCQSKNFSKQETLPVHHFKWWGNVITRLKERNKLSLPWNDELDREIKTLTEISNKNFEPKTFL